MKKKNTHKRRSKRIATLTEQIENVSTEDPMAEAGRKVLLAEFVAMLQVEAGARTGHDIEDVHKMRVSIRKMRSAFHLLEAYYKPRTIRALDRDLRMVMRVLGPVRDLDVMMHDLGVFKETLEPEQAAPLQEVIDALDARLTVARKELIKVLDSKAYQNFVKRYSRFLTTPGMGAKAIPQGRVVPYQLRHVLPSMIYQYLENVRAYEMVLANADIATLHALRIEFKRLRYMVALFAPVLGKEIAGFIEEIKTMQDHLGRLNDIDVAQQNFNTIMDDLEGDHKGVLWIYLESLEAEIPEMVEKTSKLWTHFCTKTVQRKLATAILAL